MKKQRDIFKNVKNGVCFPIALYNVYPKIFKDNKEIVLDICKKLDNLDYNIADMIKFFNKYLAKEFTDEYLDFKLFETNKDSYLEFQTFLNANENSKFVLTIEPVKNPKHMHAVSYLGYDKIKGILYFDNADEDLIDKYCDYKSNITDNISSISPNVLYMSVKMIVVVFLGKGENSCLRNFSSRLDLLTLENKVKDFKWI